MIDREIYVTIHCHDVSQQGIYSLEALDLLIQRVVPWSSDGGAVLKIKEKNELSHRPSVGVSLLNVAEATRRPVHEKNSLFSSFSFFDLSFVN
jgi:hypothetical protein